MVKIGNDWDELLKEEFQKDYYLELRGFLKEEYSSFKIYPSMHDIFNALKNTAYKDTKVVILGQDPYHEPNQAHGLSFSVQGGTPKPPSLVNIFKEIKDDLNIEAPNHGCLEQWSDRGVLLLNTVLTVRKGQANSHQGKGWEILTDEIIKLLNEREEPIAFILWGANARSKKAFIKNKKHLILESPHPSPLSSYRGFFGCKHFSKTNEFLKSLGEEPIDWAIK